MVFGKHINRYYLKYLAVYLLGIAALLLVDFVQLTIPKLYNYVITGVQNGAVEIDGILKTFDINFLLDEICLPMMLVIGAMVIGRFLWRICFFGTAIRVETDLRDRMFDRCKDLSQQFYQVNKVGNLMSLFTNDLETIQESFGDGILMLFDALLLGAMAVAKMIRMNPLLSLFALIPLIFLFIMSTIIGKQLTRKWDERQQAFSNLSDFAQENFSGIAVIKAFVKETKELLAFRKLNKDNEDKNVSFVKTSTLMHIMVTFFVESVVCVIIGYGGYLVHVGVFKVGDLLEFIGYFNSVIWPIMAVSELIDMRSRGKASLNRISELLDREPDVVDSDEVYPMERITGDIEFRNLSFTYPGAENETLHNVSFKINAGENVGIIGKTGAGKTTIVDLLLRVYNVPDGTIFLDGRDINTIPIRTVRRDSAYVPQDNFLFSDTISNNISFATDSDGNAEEGWAASEAAELAAVDDNIQEFPLGYDTVLGERGVTVSGGQKQRISIARALMKDAGILILDDSVSAVDVDTERVILGNLRKVRKGKTTILIAHRISTVEQMDKILLVEDGTVIAAGDHKTLYETCDAYRTMVELQRLEDEKEGEA